MKLPLVLAFTAMTAFFWGIYGVVLHRGTLAMNHSSLRAFVGVGLAYFLIAVLVPVALLNRKREVGYWSVGGTLMSLFAGAVGALGALGVTLALAFKGQAIYVMPIVFGGAPVVNTLLTSWLNKSFKQIKPLFLVGMVLVVCGMIGVFLLKPQDKSGEAEAASFFYVAASIALAVVCWGAYGPFLHLGQSKMGGSRLRPFCCVGIAYFIIAVACPIVMLESMKDGGEYSWAGMFWSVLAGTAGAMGALGIILAFTYGGKPIFVMPLVFGFAPVVNTIVGLTLKQQLFDVSFYFLGAIALGIFGAVTVLLNAPKAAPHGKPDSKPASPPPQASIPEVHSPGVTHSAPIPSTSANSSDSTTNSAPST